MSDTGLIVALLFVVGLVGVVVPVLPGLVLVWAGALLWALDRSDLPGWITLGLVTAAFAAGTVAKYLFPGRRLREDGVGRGTLAAGGLLGIVGFFVVPVVGLPLGFVLGIYLAEYARLRDQRRGLAATRAALRAVGWSILIELAAGFVMIGCVVGVAVVA
ncbi:MAG: DUF456 domain-containing protein [Kineosporiaceae bacterium]